MTKNRKIDDTKPFVHGQEGTHFACQEMVEKYGGKTQCCGCTGHKCTPTTPENRKIECSHVTCAVQGVPDRYLHGKTPTTPEPSDYIIVLPDGLEFVKVKDLIKLPQVKTLLAQREKSLIEKLHKSMKDNLGIMFATPSDPYHIDKKAYIKCLS